MDLVIALSQNLITPDLVITTGSGLCTLSSSPTTGWAEAGRPYLRGIMIDQLRSVMKPKDLKVAPTDFFLSEGVRDMMEWTLLRQWVRQWLNYVHWYAREALSPQVSLEAFFKAPVVQSSIVLMKS